MHSIEMVGPNKFVYKPPSYKSKMFEICQEEQKRREQEESQREKDRRLYLERKRKYDQLVKENYSPQPARKDTHRESDPVKFEKPKRQAKEMEEIRKIGNDYLRQIKSTRASVQGLEEKLVSSAKREKRALHIDKQTVNNQYHLPERLGNPKSVQDPNSSKSLMLNKSQQSIPNYMHLVHKRFENQKLAELQAAQLSKFAESSENYE